MSSEEELQDKLDKLEIAPILRQVKLLDRHLPLNLNPFYDELAHMARENGDFGVHQNTTSTHAPTSLEYTVRPPNCRRCRLRRQSTSVLDEYKTQSTLSSVVPEPPPTTLSRTTLGVQRQPLKRSPVVGINKKIILREPVLRALQMCCSNMHGNGKRKLQSPSITTTTVSTSISTSTSVRKESLALPVGEQLNLLQPVTTRGMTDFRDLISECQHLLDHDVEFGGRQRSIGQRGSNNFNTMQTHKPIVVGHTLVEGRRHSFCNTVLTGDLRLLNPPSSSITSRTSSPLPEQNAVSHASTSCSQQAGNRATAGSCDDVTIDELASYFETLVHIPKKMSSMAEMMYI